MCPSSKSASGTREPQFNVSRVSLHRGICLQASWLLFPCMVTHKRQRVAVLLTYWKIPTDLSDPSPGHTFPHSLALATCCLTSILAHLHIGCPGGREQRCPLENAVPISLNPDSPASKPNLLGSILCCLSGDILYSGAKVLL